MTVPKISTGIRETSGMGKEIILWLDGSDVDIGGTDHVRFNASGLDTFVNKLTHLSRFKHQNEGFMNETMKKVDELLSRLVETDVPKTEKLDGKAPLGDKPKPNTEGDAANYAKEKKERDLGKMTEIDDLLEKLSKEPLIGDKPKEAGETNPEGNKEKTVRKLGQIKEDDPRYARALGQVQGALINAKDAMDSVIEALNNGNIEEAKKVTTEALEDILQVFKEMGITIS